MMNLCELVLDMHLNILFDADDADGEGLSMFRIGIGEVPLPLTFSPLTSLSLELIFLNAGECSGVL